MEHPNSACSEDGFSDVNMESHFDLPEEMLAEILKYLNNGKDLANARLVCQFWLQVATPLYLSKIDDIEINFSSIHREVAIYRRSLADEYREKQRKTPNQKLSPADILEIDHKIAMSGDSRDTICYIAKYCDYIEAGGAIEYTNFNFVGINLNKSEMVHRFFALCGRHVKILTVSNDHGQYWYCDNPEKLCPNCADVERQNKKCVVTLAGLGTMMQTYCPNVAVLTIEQLPTKKRDVSNTDALTSANGSDSDSDGSYEDVDSDDAGDDDDEELAYLMVFGNVWTKNSDTVLELEQRFPPTFRLYNIRKIRVVDQLVKSLFQNMFVYQLFMVCPNVTSASNFGKMKDAFESHTFDFVRALVTNSKMDNITELFLRNLDATTIHTLLDRHKSRLHLKFLKVNHLVTHLAEPKLLEFLESQSATLETIMCGLTQKKNPSWSEDSIRFPDEMPKLTHLRIGLGKYEQILSSTRPVKKVAPINWTEQFPSLKTLMLPEFATNVSIESFFEHPYSVDGLQTVTRLELPAQLPKHLMERAGLLFPNVTELAVGYQTLDSMCQIWTMWPGLKSLHLSAIYSDERDPERPETEFLQLDELLTGFDRSQMEMARSGNLDIGEPKFPSITKLTDIRELTIFAASYRTDTRRCILNEINCKEAHQNAVTDISVQHALIKLPSLKYLDISQHLHNISPSIGMELCNQLNLLHEDNVTTRNNFTIMCNYRGREDAHAMCRLDTFYKDQ